MTIIEMLQHLIVQMISYEIVCILTLILFGNVRADFRAGNGILMRKKERNDILEIFKRILEMV